MSSAVQEVRFGQIVRLTKDLESMTGILAKGTTFVVVEVSGDSIVAQNGYGEYNLPPDYVQPL